MRNLFILFCFISMAATCQDNKSKTQDKDENPCAPDIMCTMEFKIIDLEIKNSAGEAIVLDKFDTEIDGEEIEIPTDVYELSNGSYPVITDSQMKDLDFEGKKVVFFGLINGKIEVEHQMIIGKDCCHIQLVKGETNITI